ncbi:hypothetical protein [Gordonia sp. FQ]|uniref:hypothetical protein n=1 Tax=Gordonia sp. FQ TaxID=3446634 RepID=UPI003F856176
MMIEDSTEKRVGRDHRPPSAPRSTRAALWAVSAAATAVICWPLFGGYLLHRDAVAVPRVTPTAAAFGIGDAPPRAVPQDGALALATTVFDGGFLVAAIIALSLLAAGIGYGRLALRLVPGAGTAGAVAAAVAGIWNPFVAERLLQGHWSLLTGYAALGWIVCAAGDDGRRGWRRWAVLAGLFAVAGLTPTGSVLALIVGVLAMATAGRGPRAVAGTAALWLVTALPWLVTSALGPGSATGVGGAREFAARAEPGLGTFGSALGLGGIWNAGAVPGSRTSGWAAAATACLLVVVAGGAFWLWRQRAEVPATAKSLAALALSVVVLVTLAATGPGLHVVDALLAHVPGAGLLRDTQKYLALAVPFVALAAAAAATALRRWVPTGFAVAVIALLVVGPLPDLAWGVGGALRPIHYPADYAKVTALIGRSDRAVVVLPASPMRDYPWNNAPSLSPLPRMLDAPVVIGSGLVVDGTTVDAPPARTQQVLDAVGGELDPRRLARLGVGWVVVEHDTRPGPHDAAPLPARERLLRGDRLTVYRIDGATRWPSPAPATVAASLAAHAVWLGCLIVGLVAGVWRRRRNIAA